MWRGFPLTLVRWWGSWYLNLIELLEIYSYFYIVECAKWQNRYVEKRQNADVAAGSLAAAVDRGWQGWVRYGQGENRAENHPSRATHRSSQVFKLHMAYLDHPIRKLTTTALRELFGDIWPFLLYFSKRISWSFGGVVSSPEVEWGKKKVEEIKREEIHGWWPRHKVRQPHRSGSTAAGLNRGTT